MEVDGKEKNMIVIWKENQEYIIQTEKNGKE